MPPVCIRPQDGERCALAIAHPGHELRVFGWLASNRPHTFILTDGSGRKGQPRLKSSANLLAEVGAPIGSVFGAFTDREVYSYVLAQNIEPFLRLADELARQWQHHEIDVVLGDACEGTIMSHDLWRGVIDRAVQLATCSSGKRIRNLAFSLEGNPSAAPAMSAPRHSRVELDNDAWARKIRVAEAYEGIQSEVQLAFSRWGKPAFRFESIWDQPDSSNNVDGLEKPLYERHGERQVQAGVYQQVVRYRNHVLPILTALRSDGAPGARVA